jgi:hypothetical protein
MTTDIITLDPIQFILTKEILTNMFNVKDLSNTVERANRLVNDLENANVSNTQLEELRLYVRVCQAVKRI